MSTVPINAVGTAITRLFGAALVLITLLVWGASRLTDPAARRLIATALFVYVTLGAVLMLVGQIAGLVRGAVGGGGTRPPIAVVVCYTEMC
jgi:hypothetical protein